MMVNQDVFLTGGKCAENWLLLVFEIEIVLVKAASTAITTSYVYFILFYRLVTSTYISLWENQVSSKCRYCHYVSLITSLAAAVVNKSSWHGVPCRGDSVPGTAHRCLCAVCSGSLSRPQTCSQQSQGSV